jgi:hypothetical protein
MKLFAARDEDAHQGWVWLQDPALPPRSVVRITNPANSLTVYCEALQIDQSFLREYNQRPRLSICEPQESLVIGAWYRARLGGLATQSDVPLEIKACNSWIGQFCACVHHPQVVVRLAAWLGGIGLILGVIGLGLGVASL